MTHRRAKQQLTTHVSPELAAEVNGLAVERGATVSAMVEVLLAEALRISIEHQHAALIEAAVERAVERQLGRIADMAFRSALTSDEARRLVIHMLIGQEGLDKARGVRREAHSAAWQRLSEPPPTPPEDVKATWRNGQAAS